MNGVNGARADGEDGDGSGIVRHEARAFRAARVLRRR